MPHPRLVWAAHEAERLTLQPRRVTAIVATSTTPSNVFAWSLLGLLARVSPDLLDHVCVCIDGPDPRTGDTSLQDRKQRFLEDLRGIKWHGKDMPLTVIRVWSRLGHAQAMEMAIPWVHTEHYLLMHDDCILVRDDLHQQLADYLDDPHAGLAYLPPRWSCRLLSVADPAGLRLVLPHPTTVLIVARKAAVVETGQHWHGYHVVAPFDLDPGLVEHHARTAGIDGLAPGPYAAASLDIGAHVADALAQAGYRSVPLAPDTAVHLVAASWLPDRLPAALAQAAPTIALLERRLTAFPDLDALYRKWKE